MEYIIKISNTIGIDVVNVNNYQDSNISPALTYDITNYISDNQITTGNYISVPLYNKLQYVNIPEGATISLYTKNYDEALYFYNVVIDNCKIEIDQTVPTMELPPNSVTFSDELKVGGSGLTTFVRTELVSNIDSVVMLDSLTSIAAGGFYLASIENVDIPKSVTSIDVGAFGNTNLINVVIPDSVTTINSTAFSNCRSLKSITLSKSMSVISNNCFSGCDVLEEVIIPDGIKDIYGRAFYNCISLREINIPSSVISIRDEAFLGCTNLQTITIDKPEGSITGAPWGAPNATVIWTG